MLFIDCSLQEHSHWSPPLSSLYSSLLAALRASRRAGSPTAGACELLPRNYDNRTVTRLGKDLGRSRSNLQHVNDYCRFMMFYSSEQQKIIVEDMSPVHCIGISLAHQLLRPVELCCDPWLSASIMSSRS
nr:hypothetical protein CFP56_69499 [Quercus suber]